MYSSLLFIHSILRWLVLVTIVLAIVRSYKKYKSKASFSYVDNKIRHWTATIAHLQLTVGVLLYIKSPLISYFYSNLSETIRQLEVSFFGSYHFLFMLTAIVVLTIGSAKAKRQSSDQLKFKTIYVWYTVALLLILIAIPWPFSPLVSRPYLRF